MEEINIKDFATKVRELRKAQKAFREAARKGQRNLRDLAMKHMSVLENEVDRLTLDILEPLNQTQIDLF